MKKGYLPYLDAGQQSCASSGAHQFFFELVTRDAADAPSREQVDEFYRIVKDFVESKRQPRIASGSARVTDAFYSLNILPPRNIEKYMHKSGIHDSAVESLQSDWKKVGLDLWSSTLGARLKRTACE